MRPRKEENDNLLGEPSPTILRTVQPPQGLSEKYWLRVTRYHFWYSLAGVILGLACILLGVTLFLGGIAGSTSWIASALGMESTLSDAAPGAILFVVGLFSVVVTRFNVKVRGPKK
jgi:FtsH-binding integral membrane protein